MRPVENATIPILFSPELLESLEDWSEPLQARARKSGSEWIIEFRKIAVPVKTILHSKGYTEKCVLNGPS